MNAEITVKNVTMQFKRAKDEAASLKELIIRSVRAKRKYEIFKALTQRSTVTIQKGDIAGIIGTNGSGEKYDVKDHSGRFDSHKRICGGGPARRYSFSLLEPGLIRN